MHQLAQTLTHIAGIGATQPPAPVSPRITQGNSYATYYSTAIGEVQYWFTVGIFTAVIIGFLAMLVYAYRVRPSIGTQYQSPLSLGRIVLLVAAISYAVLLGKFLFGYTPVFDPTLGAVYVPSQQGFLNLPIRYVDWAITVPLLVLELLTVSSLRGSNSNRWRSGAILASFLMIVLGYVGGVAINDGRDLGARLLYGSLSTVFFIIVYAILIHAIRVTARELPAVVSSAYKRATGLLMAVWFVYPIVYVMTGYLNTAGWVLGYQIILAIADTIAKVGFTALVIRVLRVRTAVDAQQLAAAKTVQPTVGN